MDLIENRELGVLNVVVECDTEITSATPIVCPDWCAHVVISSSSNSLPTLVLKCVSDRQPCIGHSTNDNLSYGRWEMARGTLKTIKIDGVIVECVNLKNDAFTLGTYNLDEVPMVSLLNNAVLNCPEMRGIRVLIKKDICSEGTTKHEGNAKYVIVQDESELKNMLSDEQKECCSVIADYVPAIWGMVDARTPAISLRYLKNLLPICPDAPIDAFLSNSSPTYLMTLRTCVILGMDINDADRNEIFFEARKLDYVGKAYIGLTQDECDKRADLDELFAAYMKWMIDGVQDKDSINWEFYYEMIPTYSHNFDSRVRSHKEEVMKFIEDMQVTDELMEFVKSRHVQQLM